MAFSHHFGYPTKCFAGFWHHVWPSLRKLNSNGWSSQFVLAPKIPIRCPQFVSFVKPSLLDFVFRHSFFPYHYSLKWFFLLVSTALTIVILFFVYNLVCFSFLLDLDHLFKRVFHVPPVDRCNHSPVLSGAVDSSSCQFPLAIRTGLATELDWNDFSAVSRTKLLINRFVSFLLSNSFF